MFNKNKITIDIKISDNIEIYRSDILEEVRQQLNKQIEQNYKNYIQQAVKDIVVEESKQYKKDITKHVEYWIKTMPSTELFYRDEFRKLLVDTSKTMQPELDKVIREHIKTSDCNRLYDALGENMASKFYNFIRNENN